MTAALAQNARSAVDSFVDAMQRGDHIANLTTRMEVFTLGEQVFPLSRNEADQKGNCYLCRPSAAYIDYALNEIRHFNAQPLLHGGMKLLLQRARPLIEACGLDAQVQVNNWLFSTNPVPRLSFDEAAQLRDHLSRAHPDCAIVLRSLNDLADQKTMTALAEAGFRLLPARRIWILDCRDGLGRQTRDQRRDQTLLEDERFDIVSHAQFGPEDFQAAARLYGQLYLDKYTPLNPQYRASFIEALHEAGVLHLAGLKAQGRLIAVTGLYESGATLTQPIVGYDTTLPADFGLYRRIIAYSTARAAQGRKFFNMSAGAAGFKQNRGAMPAIEYTAVYVGHLGGKARVATGAVERLLRRIGIPLLERFDL